MVNKGDSKKESKTNVVKKVLITQPRPEGERSPYFDLAKKHDIELHFHPFIKVDSIPAKEFRKQKIEITKKVAWLAKADQSIGFAAGKH